MPSRLSTLSDYLDYCSQEQEINPDIFHQISLQTDETSEFPEFEKKLYFNDNTNSSQNSQQSQNNTETIPKSKGMFEVAKEDFGKRHTHKKDDKDNILRKITNIISKAGINRANELIQKNTTKKYRLNIVCYKGKFNKEDYPNNFLNQTLKNYFSQIPNNKKIIDELTEENRPFAEFLGKKFEDYIEDEDISKELIKTKKKLSKTNEQTYIDKFEQYWKNLKGIINKTLKREIKK